MRALGIDFGERRIGLAISDPEGLMALPLTTIERVSDHEAAKQIAAIAADEEVTLLVIGEPRAMDGTRGAAAERVAGFRSKLERLTGLACRVIDESLTSVAAEERLREAGVNPRENPGRIDAIAAQILLQEALDYPESSS